MDSRQPRPLTRRQAELHEIIKHVLESGASMSTCKSFVDSFWAEVVNERFLDQPDDDLTRAQFVKLSDITMTKPSTAIEVFDLLARRSARWQGNLAYCPKCRLPYRHESSCSHASLLPIGDEVAPVLSRSQLLELADRGKLSNLRGIGTVKTAIIRRVVERLDSNF